MPLTARSRTSSGGPVRRGPTLATYTVSRAHDMAVTGDAFSMASGAWAVSADGAAAGFVASGARLAAPDSRPEGWIAIEAVGGGEAPGALMPWLDEIHDGADGTVVVLGEDRRVSVRVRNQPSREVRVYGAGTAVRKGDAVRLYAVIG